MRSRALRAPLRSAKVRSALLGLVFLIATGWFASYLDGYEAVGDWLFLVLARIWAWQMLLTLSCLSIGHLLLVRVLRLTELPDIEQLALSLPLGLLAFAMGIFLGGFAHVLRPAYAVLLPVVMLVAGAKTTAPWLRAMVRPAFVASPLSLAWAAFGVLGIGVLYLGVLSPDSVNFDAVWNHLVIAQDYAREGRIVAFPGDWVKTLPHLGSVINTWAFLVPGFDKPAERWMMGLHDEFTVFLWTLVGVSAGARYLAESASVAGGWVAVFLFPSIFIYDGNMGAAADHFLALFAVPVFLSAARLCDAKDVKHGVLFGAFVAAALLTKIHAIYLIAPVAVMVAVAFVVVCARRLRGEDAPELAGFARGIASALGTFFVVSSPHFVSSGIFYHNPVYPFAQNLIHSRPYLPDAQKQFDYLVADYNYLPPRVLSQRVGKALEMMFTFSFKPHYTWTHDQPTFGSLLTLLLPGLLFIGRARKLWLGMAVCMGALFMWAMTMWVDRNLQTFMPLMAAVVAALLFRVWQVGALARVGVSALVFLQVVWAGDWYFSGNERIANAMTLIRSSIEGHARKRFKGYRSDYVAIGKALPHDAVVLLHGQHSMLGIDRPVLLDLAGFQGAIDYRTLRTPRDLYDRLRQLGVSHVIWAPGTDPGAYRQEDVVFDLFAHSLLPDAGSYGRLRVAEMPRDPPPRVTEPQVVAWRVTGYPDGTYPVSALNACEIYPEKMKRYPKRAEHPLSRHGLAAALQHADAALIGGDEKDLDAAARKVLRSRFFEAERTTKDLVVYGKKPDMD